MSGQRVGVIGLGAMGGAVAERLSAQGFDVSVFDLNAAAVQRLVALGAKPADATSISDVDVLFTSLPHDRAVLDVLHGETLDRLTGGVLVELSTVLPGTVRDVQDRAQAAGVVVVDSPVSGGPAEARAGKLILFVGAEDADLERVRPLLDAIGAIEHVGGVGAGKAIKLVNNTMSMGNLAVGVEAFSLGKRLGLDAATMYDVLTRSGGRSHHFVKRIPYVLDDDYSARFALRLGEKDLRLALELGHESVFPMPVAATIHQLFEAGMAAGLGNEDMVAILKLYERGNPE